MDQDDERLIAQVKAGDSFSYTGIVRKYQSRILALCVSMLSDFKEAEDAAQEIFVKAFYALPKFKENSSFYTWIYRIASNHCVDLVRKKSRRRAESWERLLEEKGDEIEKLLSKDEGAGQSAQEQELVRSVLSFLPAAERLILTLREMQGMTYEEMSGALHCSVDAVKGRLKRARQNFKEQMRHFLNLENV